MSGPERDPDVDAWLQARRPQLRAGDLTQSLEPPEDLDQLIIDRARRELRQSPPPGHGFFRSSRFAVPVSIAATLVLSFTLVLQFNRYESQQDAAATLASAPNAPVMTLESAAEPAAPALAPAPAPRFARSLASTAREASATREASAARAALAAKTRADNAVSDSRGLVAAQNAAASRPGSSHLEQAEAATATTTSSASGLSSERAEIQPDTPRTADSRSTRSRRDFETDKAAGAAVLRAAPVEVSQPSLFAAPPPAPLPQVVLAAPQWWAEVQKLQTAGRHADAARELAALRKAYPDFVVPAEANSTSPAAAQPEAAKPEPPRP